MAKLKARLTREAWEKLPETERGWYVAIDSGTAYVADVEAVDGWGLENIHGLKNTVDALRAEKSSLEKRLKDGGPDAEVSRQLAETKAELESLRKADPEGKANARLQAAEQTWKQKFDQTTTEYTARESKLKSALDRQLRVVKLQSALASKKARPERLDHLTQLFDRRVKMIERGDGEYVPTVVNEDGTPAYSRRTGKLTEPMELDELADEAMRALPEMFQGHEASGMGAGHARGVTSTGYAMSKKTALENPSQYYALRDSAAKAGAQVTLTD
jgi:hypothetical protein